MIEERLLKSGWDVLSAHGPDNFSFDLLARAARASKKTFYARWANKREFLQALLDDRLDLLLDNVVSTSRVEGSAPQFLLAHLASEFFRALASPVGRQLERLVDWLDVTADSEQAWLAREATFEHVVGLMSAMLETSGCFTGIAEPSRHGLVNLWIDGIVGRSRTCPRPTPDELEQWAQVYSKYFCLVVTDSAFAENRL